MKLLFSQLLLMTSIRNVLETEKSLKFKLFLQANMEDEAEMDDGGDDPDNEDEEEDQMAEVESEIEALLEIPVLLCGKNSF